MSDGTAQTDVVECSECGHRFLAENARTTHKYRSDGMWIVGNPGTEDEEGPWCPRLQCQTPITESDEEVFERVQ